jgi:hypothetical protein
VIARPGDQFDARTGDLISCREPLSVE